MDEWDQQTSAYSPLLIALIGTHVVGLDRRTGKRIWDWDSQSTYWARMAIANDRIFVGGGADRIACLAHDNGKLLWDVVSPVGASGTFLVDGNEMIVAWAGEVAAFSTANGKLLWHDPFEGYGTHQVALGIRNVGVVQIDQS